MTHKSINWVAAVAVTAALLFTGCAGTAHIEKDNAVDFSKYKTYAWVDKEEEKGKFITMSVKSLSKDNYMIQFSTPLEAGEYGFVWVKNMELKEFNVFAFGIDWKNSD